MHNLAGTRYLHFMANRRGKSGRSDAFIFLGSIITEDSDCSCEIKRLLLLGRKAMTNPDSILKSGGITLPMKDDSKVFCLRNWKDEKCSLLKRSDQWEGQVKRKFCFRLLLDVRHFHGSI